MSKHLFTRIAAILTLAVVCMAFTGVPVAAATNTTSDAVTYYDANGNPITISGMYYNNQGYPMYNAGCYYLDENGDPIYVGGCRAYYYDENGELVPSRYLYDEDGNAISPPSSYYGGWGCGYYRYDAQGNLANGMYYYDEDGNAVNPSAGTTPRVRGGACCGGGYGFGWRR